MNQDFKQVAEEAIAQCKAYESQIAGLKEQLSKKASAEASEDLAQKSVQALVKVGCLDQAQREEALGLLKADHNACLRTIQALCQERAADAQSSIKKEAAAQQLNFGTIVDKGMAKEASVDERQAYRSVAAILGLNLN